MSDIEVTRNGFRGNAEGTASFSINGLTSSVSVTASHALVADIALNVDVIGIAGSPSQSVWFSGSDGTGSVTAITTTVPAANSITETLISTINLPNN